MVLLARRAFLLTALKAFDALAMIACFAASVLMARPTSSPGLAQLLSARIKVSNVLLFAALVVLWHVVLDVAGVYRSKRLVSRPQELMGIVRATAVATAVIYVISVLLRVQVVQGAFAPVLLASTAGTMIASRVLLRWGLGVARRHGRNLRHLLVVGTNSRAVAFARMLEARPEVGYRVVGFLDSRAWAVAHDFDRSGFPLIGNVGELPETLRRRVVDEVAVFLPLKSFYDLGSRIVSQCEEQGVHVTFPSCHFALRRATGDADRMVTVAPGGMLGGPAVLKRVIDVAVASCALVALAPLLLVIAAVVKLTSSGPVLFCQDRLGLNKRRFRMIKFRTMVADAERRQGELEALNEADGPVFKIARDPRITRIGALLRKTSIDELPQLWNVLKGDLSLVGPRPLPIRDYEGFSLDWHRRRFSVRPGITCLWQIGGRSQLSFDRWMELDMEYIDNWSLWLDLKILLKTIPTVLRGTGAA